MLVSTGFQGRELINYEVNVLIKSHGLEEVGSRTGDDLHNTVMPNADALTDWDRSSLTRRNAIDKTFNFQNLRCFTR